MSVSDMSPAPFDISLFDSDSYAEAFFVRYDNGSSVVSVNIADWVFTHTAYLGSTATDLPFEVLATSPGKVRIKIPKGLLLSGKTYTHSLVAVDGNGNSRLILGGVIVVKSSKLTGGTITAYSIP